MYRRYEAAFNEEAKDILVPLKKLANEWEKLRDDMPAPVDMHSKEYDLIENISENLWDTVDFMEKFVRFWS